MGMRMFNEERKIDDHPNINPERIIAELNDTAHAARAILRSTIYLNSIALILILGKFMIWNQQKISLIKPLLSLEIQPDLLLPVIELVKQIPKKQRSLKFVLESATEVSNALRNFSVESL